VVVVTDPVLHAAAVAVCLLAGVPWVVAGSIAVGSLGPEVGLMAVVALHLARRRRAPNRGGDEAVVLAALGAELRRGASVRTAIEPAAARSAHLDLSAAVRLAEAGAPVERVAEAFARGLPQTGRLAGPAFVVAATSGGRASAVFARLADRASARLEAEGERRALTAQARLSAAVVGAIPCVVLGSMALTGRLSSLLEAGPFGVVAVTVGSVLMLTGMAVVVALTRRTLK